MEFLIGAAVGAAALAGLEALGIFLIYKKVKPELKRLAEKPPPKLWQTTDYQLKLEDLAGRKFSLEDYKGKVLFLNFWGTGCGPCVAEMPSIQKLYERVRENPNIAILTISIQDDPSRLEKFLDKNGYAMPAYLMADEEEPKELSVKGIPSTFVVSRDGKIVYHHAGAANWASEEFVRYLEDLAQKPQL